MKIVSTKISMDELKKMAGKYHSNLVKAVVDVDKKIMAVDADLHSDEEKFLLEKGSRQKNLWGINIYPSEKGASRIEFDSMINIRPAQENFTRGVDNEKLRVEVTQIVNQLIK